MNGRRRGRHDGGLGAEGHPQARRGDHPQVVGAVAHHHGPLQRHAVGARPLAQAAHLLLAVHDPPPHPAGEHAPLHLQAVGGHVVQAQAPRQGHHDLLEAAGDHPHAAAAGVQRPDELDGARRGAHLVQHLSEDRLRHPPQGGDTLAQRVGEVELAAHRPGGDGGHPLARAGALGDELDDLLLDERGVGVHDQQPGAQPRQGPGGPPAAHARRGSRCAHGPMLAGRAPRRPGATGPGALAEGSGPVSARPSAPWRPR